MSEVFDILSGALDEAIADAKSTAPMLRQETISLEIAPLHINQWQEGKHESSNNI